MIKLIITEGSKTYSRYFAEAQISVGRAEQSHLQLHDRKCSRNHCRIDQVADGYKLVDLESQNGTLLNGQSISQKILRPGDKITIGEAAIYFQKAPEGFREDKRAAQSEKLALKLRKTVEEMYRALGEEGLFEGEKVFTEVLDKRGLSSLRNLESRYNRLVKLQETSNALNSELQLNKLLALIIDSAIELTRAARGFVIIFNREGKMEIPVARNFDREFIHKPDFKISKSIAEEVGISGRAVLTANASDDDRFSASMSVMKLNLCSILCVPVQSPERMLGVIYLDNPFQEGVFSRDDLAILSTFADQSAVALKNSLLIEELGESKKIIEEAHEAAAAAPVMPPPVEADPDNVRSRDEFVHDYSRIIGNSPRMMEIFDVLDKVIGSDVPVLIQGESGTGKELIARAIHENSTRSKRAFVSENCAAIASTLLESELFGHTKGAFTGATADKSGLFELADGGTMFLDEIGETSLDMQKKLLRVLQEGEFRPVGGGSPTKVDFRLISASNRDLRQMIEKREFREDLFYRINVINVVMPALRDRREDIPVLVEHFLTKFAGEDKERLTVSPQAMAYMVNYDWPGNVRELENEIQRCVALTDGEIQPEILSESFFPKQAAKADDVAGLGDHTLKEIVKAETEKVERRVILEALKQAGWKKNATAKILGISRPTLDAKIDAYDLKKPDA